MCPVGRVEEGVESAAEGSEGEEMGDLFGDGEIFCDQGARTPVKLRDPRKPSAEEVALHEMTHLPFRSWCSHCVRGRGRAADHRAVKEERGVGEIHVDYGFVGSAESDTKTILVAKHLQTKSLLAMVVPMKGMSHEFPAKRIRALSRELGLMSADVIFKGDQEPALQDLREVGRVRAPARSILEESPVGSSQSNGRAERAVQSISGQLRVMKDALQTMLGIPVDPQSVRVDDRVCGGTP